jgi:hypothetical protein
MIVILTAISHGFTSRQQYSQYIIVVQDSQDRGRIGGREDEHKFIPDTLYRNPIEPMAYFTYAVLGISRESKIMGRRETVCPQDAEGIFL